MLKELKWQPLAERRKDQRLCLLYKILNDLVAIPADQYITYNHRPARNKHTKTIINPRCTTNIYMNSFFPRTINDWNTLKDSEVNSTTLETFKKSISPNFD